MKPTLVDKPNNYAVQELKIKFENGLALTPDQLNFLWQHERNLSQHAMDPLLHYYLNPHYKKSAEHHSFLMHSENMNADAAKELSRRLSLMTTDKGQRVKISMTPTQFQEFKNSASPSLIFHHGNQYLTGAPFHPGGIPHVVFFQWGNLFGVAKYVVLPEERALRSNVLIYFENRHERLIDECVKEVSKELHHELQPNQPAAHTNKLEKQLPQENYTHEVSHAPRLSLSLSTKIQNPK